MQPKYLVPRKANPPMPRDPYGRKRTTTPAPKPAPKSRLATTLTLGEKLCRARRRLKMPQAVLGEKVGIHQKRVSVFEHGDAVPDEALLALLAEALGVEVGYLTSATPVFYCTVCEGRPWRYWVPGDDEAYCAECFGRRNGSMEFREADDESP